ncbi:MAG: LysR family transcriptional regulator [Thainema sp.]
MTDSSLDGVKLSQLRALVAVANDQNFSEAALKLGISQSAVSHAIASLEDELGVVLLNRGRYGARPTPVGEQIIQQSRQILDMLQEIGKTANLAKGLERGQVRVGSFRSVATYLLPEVIALLQQRLPGIKLDILEYEEYSEVEQALRDGRIDAGFTHLPTPPDLESWELLRDEYLVLLPPNADITTPELTWEQIEQFDLILYPELDSSHRMLMDHCRQRGHRLSITYPVREDSTIVRMVQRGLGISIMPRLAAEPLPNEIKTYRLPSPLERVIGIAISAKTLHPPAVFAFIELLREQSQQTFPKLKHRDVSDGAIATDRCIITDS